MEQTRAAGTGWWMVRAGVAGAFYEYFKEASLIAIGTETPPRDIAALCTDTHLAAELRSWNPGRAAELHRFVCEIHQGNTVASVSQGAARILVGTVASEYFYAPPPRESDKASPEAAHARRRVKWLREIDVPADERNPLWSPPTTVFRLNANQIALAVRTSADRWEGSA